MTILILGIIVLIGIHFVPAFPDLRDSLMARLGRNGYRALFSVVSLLGLALVVWGFAKRLWCRSGRRQSGRGTLLYC